METMQLPTLVESQLFFSHFANNQEIVSRLLDELVAMVNDFGVGGGSLTPSIYDTAQVLRFAPPEEGPYPGLDWLLSHQNVDGGWGNPIAPFMRDVPTLATILTLHKYNQQRQYDCSIQNGLEFLHRQSSQWQDFSNDDLLVGVELILPNLIEEANARNIPIAYPPYLRLIQLGMQKRKMIQHLKVVRGTPAAFSWEAWGTHPNRYLLDSVFSVGNSPSATAVWIAQTLAQNLAPEVSNSRYYLQLASTATGVDIPGVVPFAWPINRFEQSFGLYALANGGLLHHPALENVLKNQINELALALTPFGMPFSDHFIPDLDDTAASIIVFRHQGRDVNPEILRVFKNETGYLTYPGEFHASTSAHARAVQALGLLEKNPEVVFQAQQVLLPFQNPDGVWPGDKWHKSWLYTTSHMLYALHSAPYLREVEKALLSLVNGQNEDGGWGVEHRSSSAETAYVLLALHLYREHYPYLEFPYRGGVAWLLENIDRKANPGENLWIGKELFKPYRIDRAFELTALIQGILT